MNSINNGVYLLYSEGTPTLWALNTRIGLGRMIRTAKRRGLSGCLKVEHMTPDQFNVMTIAVERVDVK